MSNNTDENGREELVVPISILEDLITLSAIENEALTQSESIVIKDMEFDLEKGLVYLLVEVNQEMMH